MVVLENEFLIVKAKNEGAELVSISSKNSRTEYLWQGNPDYWRFHAPICFPIVGSLIDDTCFINNEAYNMTVHGFARDMNFNILNQGSNHVSFMLTSNNETLKRYPYNFSLILSYTLHNNKIIVSYEVQNTDNKDMYFSIGAHTAFNCPIDTNLNFEDYYLSFPQEEKIEKYLLEGGFLTDKKEILYENTNRIPISNELFKNGVLILENLQNKKISIATDKNDKQVTVFFEEFPYLAIWSKPDGAPFVCIEPWFGLPDLAGLSVELMNKKAIQKLKRNETFKCNHEIII